MAVRLARAGCGSVGYWMELPITEVASYMRELIDQIAEEAKQMEGK